MRTNLRNVGLILSLLLFPFIGNAYYDVEVDGVYYNINMENKSVEVTKGRTDYSGDVIIPSSINIGNLELPVTSIGAKVFWGCDYLTSVTIGNSITEIGEEAFAYTSKSLKKVEITDLAAWCKIRFEGQLSNPLNYAHHLYMNGVEIKDLKIPNSVTSIGEYAFVYCSGLTSVTIPNSVTSIGNGAFYGCSGLKKVEISDLEAWCKISFGTYSANPLSYAHHLYMNGDEITDLKIPNSVTYIGNDAFHGCSGLTSVTIPNSVTSIGKDAFWGCDYLTRVDITDLEAWCKISFGSSYGANPLYHAHHLYMNGV